MFDFAEAASFLGAASFVMEIQYIGIGLLAMSDNVSAIIVFKTIPS